MYTKIYKKRTQERIQRAQQHIELNNLRMCDASELLALSKMNLTRERKGKQKQGKWEKEKGQKGKDTT